MLFVLGIICAQNALGPAGLELYVFAVYGLLFSLLLAADLGAGIVGVAAATAHGALLVAVAAPFGLRGAVAFWAPLLWVASGVLVVALLQRTPGWRGVRSLVLSIIALCLVSACTVALGEFRPFGPGVRQLALVLPPVSGVALILRLSLLARREPSQPDVVSP